MIAILILNFTLASKCGECHTDIYKEWKNSLHAQSFEDPVFQDAYKKIINTEEQKLCLTCHVPTVSETKDYMIKQEISKEGITCDFCHSVRDVKNGNFELEIGNIKFGPISDIPENLNIGHKNKYSEIFSKAEFCKTCHEFKNKYGVYVLDTYNEWKNSEYSAKGIHCQNCHMTEIPFTKIVDPRVYPSKRHITDHKCLGGHSEIRLKKAASLNVLYKVENKKIITSVYVTNNESGHKLPTGIPIRKLILEVSLVNKFGEIIKKQSKIYQRVLVNKNNEVIDEIDKIFTEAYRVFDDNRISPKETRREVFTFDIKDKGPYFLKTQLKYEYRIPSLEPDVMLFLIQEKELLIETEKPLKIGKLSFIIFSLIIFLIFFYILISFLKTFKKEG